jgi:exodeoxyribonuclease VII large subunit
MEQISLDWGPGRTVFTVSELSAAIRAALGNSFSNIWVAGEISGLKPAPSGHLYFTLKDTQSQIRCVCFRGSLRWMRFKPQDGIAVIARGRIDVFESRGEYQLVVDSLEPQGHGALQLAFEQLKQKLEAEGLFAAERKRPLPRLPARIGIVTSPSGAVIRDVLNIVERRFRGLHLRLYPAQVQGPGSVEQVVTGLRYFSREPWADVVIVCRGGGSLEDLWTFNEEPVARAIAACPVPVISAVGHETDFTIADFVADLRAPTPSAAAEIVTGMKADLVERVDVSRRRLERVLRLCLAQAAGRVHQLGVDRATSALTRRVGRAAQRVDEIDYRSRDRIRRLIDGYRRQVQAMEARVRVRDPRLWVGQARRRLESAEGRAVQAIRTQFARTSRRLGPLESAVHALSPLRILQRGYAIATGPSGHVLTEAAQVVVGDQIALRLAKGRVSAKVNSTEPGQQ